MNNLIYTTLSTVVNKVTGRRSIITFGIDDLNTKEDFENISRIATPWGDLSDASKMDLVAMRDRFAEVIPDWKDKPVKEQRVDGTVVSYYIQKDSPELPSALILSKLERLAKATG